MVVNNLYIFRTINCPAEANTKLVIDANAPLAFAISAQSLQLITGRNAHVIDVRCQVQLNKFPQGSTFNVRPPLAAFQTKQAFRLFRIKGPDHTLSIMKYVNNIKRYYSEQSDQSNSMLTPVDFHLYLKIQHASQTPHTSIARLRFQPCSMQQWFRIAIGLLPAFEHQFATCLECQ